ncbi:hypothetical protein SteCoe_14478 [Stentor coeruleus]|uniref:Right handed beta helix domain-containing protein n=1 Tax=Stentor coeruleus TaxID=5963 RepID=A0A1R2C651_9CILI|nr:hypothetical protein SteCoe_14478 [Stentor coeruleus]
MSSQSSQEINVSNIEKKILKNTLLANPNNLQEKDRSVSHLSLFSKTCRNYSPIHMQYLDSCMSKSSLFDFTMLKSMTKEVPLPSDTDTFQDKLQEIIDNSLSDAHLILPPGSLKLQSLQIRKSIHFKGSPGTNLIIDDGPIQIGSPEDDNKILVTFSELSFEFLSSFPCASALFTIEGSQNDLDLSDCVITYNSKNQSNDESICFSLTPADFEANIYSSTLTLDSCNISGFGSICKSCDSSSIILNKCHFSNCSSSALILTSPKVLKISHSLIEKCKKNAVEILAAAENTGHSTTRTKSSASQVSSKEIFIDNSDFKHNQGSGLIIHSENLADYNADILIDCCKIAHNKKEGICLKHISLRKMKITNSDISCNHLTGIRMQKVHRSSLESEFIISYNRIFDSFRGYGVYSYSSCPVLENNEIFRNSLGGIMIAGNCNTSIFDISKNLNIISCDLQANGENGIHICEYSNTVMIESCKISKNTKSGLFLNMNPGKDINDVSKMYIEAKHCEILGNNGFGIVCVKSKCFFSNVILEKNVEGQIEYGEGSKELVKFDSENNTSMSGLYVPVKVKKNSCRGTCTVF